ncbi:hypothetical protein EVJ58_g7424 [Rhodofomes roseus]|uniref:Reverse transcriptase n=1 Tax=Rhodofomes roseus TaxID=34475 RepID=A0A4Y9Y2T8_9APHY|nr:hypothetical protein EVJ58_g7424 [Rhodofomes roseus]
MTPKERAEYHERMRREYEHQELAQLQHLRQIEEDVWIAEQLARTPDASQFMVSGTTEGTETTEGQTPSESEDSGYYPTAELRRAGKVYEGLNNGKCWDYRTLEEKAAQAGEAPVPQEQVRYGSDERDEHMAALERHLDQMDSSSERISSKAKTHKARKPMLEPVNPAIYDGHEDTEAFHNKQDGWSATQQRGTPSPRLSDKEKDRHIAEGRCFDCHEVGHVSRDCPNRNTVRSPRKGKPLGVPAYGITPGVGSATELRKLATESGVTRTLMSAYIDVDLDEIASVVSGSSMPSLQTVSDSSSSAGSYSSSSLSDEVLDLSVSSEDNSMPDLQMVLYLLEDNDGDMESTSANTSAYYSCAEDSASAAGDSPRGEECNSDDEDELIAYDDEYERTYLPPVKIQGTYGHHFGDAYALNAARILNQVFSELYPDRPEDDQNMLVIRTSERQYMVVYDKASREITVTYICDPESDICGWCFPWLDEFLGNDLDYGEIPEIPFGHAFAVEVQDVLSKHVTTPGKDADVWPGQTQFAAKQLGDHVKLAFVLLIPNEILDNAHLDLPNCPVSAGYQSNEVCAAIECFAVRDYARPSSGGCDNQQESHKSPAQLRLIVRLCIYKMAVQGSHAKINLGCVAKLGYQNVSKARYFDVMNILNYDMILGTPFLFHHRVTIGLNLTTVVLGSATLLPIEGKRLRVLELQATWVGNDDLEQYCTQLREYTKDVSTSTMDSPLPPLHAINHTIPLIDEDKVYTWQPSKCPEALRPLWNEKRQAYPVTGRWRMTNARNTSPMLLLTKPGTGKNGVLPKFRNVIDLHQRNKNTQKIPSLPDMEGILRRVLCRQYWSMIDSKDAYKQICIEHEHIEQMAMASPDGNMVSLVLQQGDCNAVATYQLLMNHIYGPYLGKFMDVYLDDIIIYSDTVEEHLSHVKLVIDVLQEQKLYLSAEKQRYFCNEAKILRRIVDRDGICMDPDKVDSILNWKNPTNKELLHGFLGSVGYLADDIATIRIPMGILTSLIGSDSSFKWDFTHQRAFDKIKRLVHAHRKHHRVPLDYSLMADPIWLITDSSHGGIAGVVCQGADWRRARIAVFFSAKLSSAQSNYAVHKIEMLTGVEAMLRHRDILQGCEFTWITDHKGLTHLWNQKNLSGRQARWIEKLSEFNFEIEYVPGVENVLADTLSHLYSNDTPGTVRDPSEFTQHDETAPVAAQLAVVNISKPVFTGLEAMAVRMRPSTGAMKANLPEKAVPAVVPAADNETTHLRQTTVSEELECTPLEETVTADNLSKELMENIGLLDHIVDEQEGVDVARKVRNHYQEDAFFTDILRNPKHYKSYDVSKGLIYLKEKGTNQLCIPNVMVNNHSVWEILIRHAHSLLAHLGAMKTLGYLREQVWWKTMGCDIQKYCDTCMTCKHSKPSNQKPYGLLNPLPVASTPWEAIGIDFMRLMPKSKDRDGTYNTITTRLEDGLTGLLHDEPSGVEYSYPPVLLRAYSEFNRKLCARFAEGDADGIILVVPGGYFSFTRGWNRDAECQYQFSMYEPKSGSITVRGKPIPLDALAPSPQEPAAPSIKDNNCHMKKYAHLLDEFIEQTMRKKTFIKWKRAEQFQASREKASSSSVSLAGGNLPRGVTLRKTLQTVAEKEAAGDNNVTMKDAEKEFDPDLIQDYDEDERKNRRKTKEAGRKSKSKKD